MNKSYLPESAHTVTNVCANCQFCDVVDVYESTTLLCVKNARGHVSPMSVDAATTDEISSRIEDEVWKTMQLGAMERYSSRDSDRFARRYRVWEAFCRRHQVVAYMSCNEYSSREHVCSTEEWEDVVNTFNRYLMQQGTKPARRMSAVWGDDETIKSVVNGRLHYLPPRFPGDHLHK